MAYFIPQVRLVFEILKNTFSGITFFSVCTCGIRTMYGTKDL